MSHKSQLQSFFNLQMVFCQYRNNIFECVLVQLHGKRKMFTIFPDLTVQMKQTRPCR